jgi:hypothetical protein
MTDQNDSRRAQSMTVLAQLFSSWDRRASTYRSVGYRVALVKNEECWRTILTLFTPLHPDAMPNTSTRADYGDVLIISGTLPLNRAKITLQHVIVIDSNPEDIEHLIEAGESDTIEFKAQLPAALAGVYSEAGKNTSK